MDPSSPLPLPLPPCSALLDTAALRAVEAAAPDLEPAPAGLPGATVAVELVHAAPGPTAD